MKRWLARRYAHDIILRALDGALEDDEWLEGRFEPGELELVLAEVKVLRLKHLASYTEMPPRKQEAP